jgi:hypothetical protein
LLVRQRLGAGTCSRGVRDASRRGDVGAFAINAKGTITGLYGGQVFLGSPDFVGTVKSGTSCT